MGKRKLAIIIGAAVVVLGLGTTAVVVASRGSGTAEGNPTGTTASSTPPPSMAPSAGPSQSAPAATTGTQREAVAGYLDAVAKGDADAALAYAAKPVAKSPTLSKAALAASIKRTPLTQVNVMQPADPNATVVDASYRLGTQTVLGKFDVVASGGAWKLARPTADLDLRFVRRKGVDTLLNGVKVAADTVPVLPGSYQLTTTSKLLRYRKATVLVANPAAPPAVATSWDITKAGVGAGRQAAAASYAGCLKAGSPAPKGCPFAAAVGGKFKLTKGTIRWTQVGGSPFKSKRVVLQGEYAKVTAKLNVRLDARCTDDGRAAKCSAVVKGTRYAYVSLVNPKRPVRWGV